MARKKQTNERDFELIKDGVFNSDYPRSWNLLMGYSIPPRTEEKRVFNQDIKILN